jgi:hypothetical protein
MISFSSIVGILLGHVRGRWEQFVQHPQVWAGLVCSHFDWRRTVAPGPGEEPPGGRRIPASDLHLLPGLISPELKRLLRAHDLTAAGEVVEEQLFNMTGLTVTFATNLAGTPDSHGLKLGAAGDITVESAALAGRSFIVTATAKQGTATATARIRVYVHAPAIRTPLYRP